MGGGTDPVKATALIRHQPCLSQERLWKGPERSAEAAFTICVRLSHMLSRGRTPHQIVQVTSHIKENAENTSTVTLSSANNRSQMLAVCISPLCPSVLCTSCVYGLCFLVLQNWGHCASQGQAACPVRPSLTPGSVAVPWKPPDHVHASIWLEASSSPHPPALTWWHTAAQG